MVVVVERVFAGLVDHDGHVGPANFVAEGRVQFQFATDVEAERQLVEHGASGPRVVSHPGHRRKTQAGHVTDDLQHRGYGTDAANGCDVGGFLPHAVISIPKVVSVVPRPIKSILATLRAVGVISLTRGILFRP